MLSIEFNSEERTKAPILFLHGFPGIQTQQNRAIAEAAARELNRRAVVVLYSGLTQAPGRFSFRQTRNAVLTFADQLRAESPTGKIDLVGHSWGGYLSFQIAAHLEDSVEKVVLLSPLIRFFDPASSAEFFQQVISDNPSLDLGNLRELAAEFREVGEQLSVLSALEKFSPQTKFTILQAQVDELTPAEVALQTAARMNPPPQLEILKVDHSFLTDRPLAIERVIFYLR